MNFDRLSANAGLAFFTSLGAFSVSGLKGDIVFAALVAAAIQAGLVFFSEWKKEEEGSLGKIAMLLSLSFPVR